MRACIFILSVLFFTACAVSQNRSRTPEPSFYKVGHRGTRGFMPENTIASMQRAIDLGANTIEFDVSVSKDKKIFVTHDQKFNPTWNSFPDGRVVEKKDVGKYTFYQMNYDEIRKIIVGGKPNPDFPQQSKVPSYMPLMTEMIDSVENYTKRKKLDNVFYLLEIKSNPKADGKEQPAPEEYMALLMAELKKSKLGNRLLIQSFDARVLQVVHRLDKSIPIGYLMSKLTVEENLKTLGFNPTFYNPKQDLVNKEVVDLLHSKGIKIMPWTVNTAEDVTKLKSLGVDGIITDFPNLL